MLQLSDDDDQIENQDENEILHTEQTIFEPKNYADAMASPEAEKWALAMDEEFESLKKNKTWSLV